MESLQITELPSPPAGKTGWPWTNASPQLSESMPDGCSWPRVSIITPSFNQGQFIEETIRSVLLQGYPNLEYIIMDGGSTDNSLDIIRKYQGHFAHWECGPDKGQADAINRGFSIASGDILAWLNSDDMHFRGTLNYISKCFGNPLEHKIIFGNCLWFDQETKNSFGSNVELAHRTLDLSLTDYIIQPSCFWTKTVWEKVGPLNINLVYGFDWDWFIRAKKLGIDFQAFGEFLSLYRLHAQHKTATGGETRIKEIAQIYHTYHSAAIADTYLTLSLDPKLRFAWKLMRMLKFPWRYRVLRFLFFPNLTEMQFECISKMAID